MAPHAADGRSRQGGGEAAGDSLRLRRLYRSFTRVAQSAGLRVIRLHDTRHGAATLLTAAGLAPRVVMEILGHSQISNHHGRVPARRAGHPARGHETHGPAAEEVPRSSVTVAVDVRPGCQTPHLRISEVWGH
ncbi:tyrosine-type recombinase/integrase [Streptomyces bottropensis]|uniref:tyrosine-type recombinase/integrase n=1 Tax=Streptomyces bottropensis TaxID=42235 RepID=UPI003A8CCF63